jgi:hypothetical protein
MNLTMRRLAANLAAVAVAVAGLVLLRFDPATSGFYPHCPVFFWLHLYCPGCGGTRALAALLHGRLGEAVHWNPLAVIFLPFAAAFCAVAYGRAMKPGPFVWPTIPDAALRLCLVLIGFFTVLRNIPTI